MNFKDELGQKTERIESILSECLPQEKGYQKTVFQAMNYSVMAGGKRLRPMLMEESTELFCDAEEVPALPAFMAALEMIHNYSLVHDDLPAMDDDEYRRGRRTTHVVYGEGMAILAGDGLLNYAFETASGSFDNAANVEEYRRIASSLQILGRKAGIYGMIGGQCADLEAEESGDAMSDEMLLFIHEHKTAALIQAAMMIGATLAGAEQKDVMQLEKCAYDIGLAFQIQDDILDVTGCPEVLGKPVGSDEKNHKLTYVAMHGLEESKEKVKLLSEEAINILSSFPRRNLFLEELVRQLIYREK